MFRIRRSEKPEFRPYTRREILEDLGNPYRGVYSIYRFRAESDCVEDTALSIKDCTVPHGHRLALVEIHLGRYKDSPLPEDALHRIRRIFQCFAKQKCAMILRFLYDWDGAGIQHEPESRDVILSHMEQLEPLFGEFSDSIFLLQGLFTGSWGEMHSTRYDSARDMLALAEKLFASVPEGIFLSVRCPNQWRTLFRTRYALSQKEAHQTIMQSRFGLYNDAILGSETDLGTYGTQAWEKAALCGEKLTRTDELMFQKKLCQYVPNGGEVVYESPLNDLEPAIQTLETMHVTYLNCDYDAAVLEKWKKSRISRGKSAWSGCSGYDYIAAHLGYRFLIKSMKMRGINGLERGISFEMELVNEGFAPCYRPLQAGIVLTARGQEVHTFWIETDTRMWLPMVGIPLRCELDLSKYPKGKYQVGIRICCPHLKEEIRLANTPPHLESGLTNPVGEVWI
jgi:hypothetical protein